MKHDCDANNCPPIGHNIDTNAYSEKIASLESENAKLKAEVEQAKWAAKVNADEHAQYEDSLKKHLTSLESSLAKCREVEDRYCLALEGIEELLEAEAQESGSIERRSLMVPALMARCALDNLKVNEKALEETK